MICLVHGVLVLALLLVIYIVFVIRVFDHFVHLDLISYTWWTLRVLNLMNISLMNIVFTATRCSRPWIRIDTSHSILSWVIWVFLLANIDSTSLGIVVFEWSLSMYRGQKRIVLSYYSITSTKINVIVIIIVILGTWRVILIHLRPLLLILLAWTQIVIILHVGTHHVLLLNLSSLFKLSTGFHHVLLARVVCAFALSEVLGLEVFVGSSLSIALIERVVVVGCGLGNCTSGTAVQHFRREDHLLLSLDLSGLVDAVNAWGLTVVLWVLSSKFVEEFVLNCLPGSDSLVRVHRKKFLHQIDFNLVHNWSISCFNGFGMRDLWKLEALVSCVTAELFL